MTKKLYGYLLIIILLLFSYIGCNSSLDSAVLSVDRNQCTGCASCVYVCKADAIRIISNKAVIDLSKCIKCGSCVEVCPENAIY